MGWDLWDLPSGTQRWQAGKWIIEINDFPMKASISRDFPLPCLITDGNPKKLVEPEMVVEWAA